MQEITYLRRAAWVPVLGPFLVPAVEATSGSGEGIIVGLIQAAMFGGVVMPFFIAISLRVLRGKSVLAHWRFGLAAPFLFALVYIAVNPLLLHPLIGHDTDLPASYAWTALYAVVAVGVGYVYLVVVAALRFVLVSRNAA